MRIKRTGFGIAAIAMTAGLITVPQLPALAAARTTTISITATSGLKVTGDVLVVFKTKAGSASISGAVSSTTSGQVLKLFAQQFPFKKAPAPLGSPVTMPTGSATPYSFKVTPTLATHYKVELFQSDGTTLVAGSATTTVFVAAASRVRGVRTCNRPGNRPVCHQTVRLRTTVPASTLRIEKAKKWYVYFGLSLRRVGIPPAPKFLRLGAGSARVSRARRVSASQYEVTITFTFRVDNDGYFWLFFPCQKDTEAKDGLNLPGHHGCGSLKVISSRRVYLG